MLSPSRRGRIGLLLEAFRLVLGRRSARGGVLAHGWEVLLRTRS